MNSQIRRSGLVLAALCCALLAGCNAVESVEQPAFTPPPTQTAVLEGKITGLGTRRPLVLRYSAGSGDRSFLGILDQQTIAFSFGSLPVGTPYDITVSRQPFGKNCTVANGTGAISTTPADITVTCVNDATPRFCVGGTITQAVHDTPGAKVILTTEEGTREVAAATLPAGIQSCWFPDSIFDSQTSVPVFIYRVTASYDDANGTRNNCGVTNPTNPTSGAGSEAGPVSPTAAVTNVQVTTCSFPVNVNVAYNGTPTKTLAAPMTMELRDPRTGQRVLQKNPVTGANVEVPPITVAAFGTVTFAGILSNEDAMYDLVITGQPTVGGQQVQTCVVGNTGTAQLTAGSAALLIDPADPTHGFVPAASATNPAAGINKNVRCRDVPVLARRLRGTYQQTSIATTMTTSTPPVITVTTTKNRNFLTFFEDGTFLYDVHALGNQAILAVGTVPPAVPNSGVEHGFYDYNNAAATITFTPLTDSITGTNANRISSAGAAATMTAVVKTAGALSRITGKFSATMSWQLDEPLSLDNEMTGAWASADHRQVWVYEANNYRGLYVGVNGMATAADSCWPIDPTTALTGFFSRRGNATTCQLGEGPPGVSNIYTMTIPNAASVPRLPEGYVGRWPESQTNADGRPSSPASFQIDIGTPDKLTVQDTLNGVPVYVPFVFYRIRSN